MQFAQDKSNPSVVTNIILQTVIVTNLPLVDGLRRLMSYKLASHVLITFTEQLVPIHKHITALYSEFHRYQEQKQSQ